MKNQLLLTLLVSSLTAQASESQTPPTGHPDTPFPQRRASRTQRIDRRKTAIIAGHDERPILTGISDMSLLQEEQADQAEKAAAGKSTIIVKNSWPEGSGSGQVSQEEQDAQAQKIADRCKETVAFREQLSAQIAQTKAAETIIVKICFPPPPKGPLSAEEQERYKELRKIDEAEALALGMKLGYRSPTRSGAATPTGLGNSDDQDQTSALPHTTKPVIEITDELIAALTAVTSANRPKTPPAPQNTPTVHPTSLVGTPDEDDKINLDAHDYYSDEERI